MGDAIKFSDKTIEYLEKDLESYKAVLLDSKLKGKLGFGMIATAMAAFETYGYILYGQKVKSETRHRFTELLKNCHKFYPETRLKADDMIYDIIRNGVLHQLYPKNIGIYGELSDSNLVLPNGDSLCINSYTLYCEILMVLRGIHDYMINGTTKEKQEWSKRLDDRLKEDRRDYRKRTIQTSISTVSVSKTTTATQPPPD